VSSERNPDLLRRKNLGEPCPNIIGGYLDKKDGVRGVSSAIARQLGQECSWDEKQKRQDEIPKGEGLLRRIIVKADNSPDMPWDISEDWIVITKVFFTAVLARGGLW
jgi:hypothetical protein